MTALPDSTLPDLTTALLDHILPDLMTAYRIVLYWILHQIVLFRVLR